MTQASGGERAYLAAPVEAISSGAPELHPVELAVSALLTNLRESSQLDPTRHTPEIVERNDRIVLLRSGVGSCASLCTEASHPRGMPAEGQEVTHTIAVISGLYRISPERVRIIEFDLVKNAAHSSRRPLHEAIANALTAAVPNREKAATQYGAGRLLVKLRYWNPV